MRTAAELAQDLNNLNGNSVDGRYNGVTEKQIAFVMAETRKIQWTDKKPDRAGWWFHKWNGVEGCSIMRIYKTDQGLRVSEVGMHCYLSKVNGQWSDSPIQQPDEP